MEEGIPATYRVRYSSIKTSSGQSIVSASTERDRDVAIEGILLCDRLIYSRPPQTLLDPREGYFGPVDNAWDDLGNVLNISRIDSSMVRAPAPDKYIQLCTIKCNLYPLMERLNLIELNIKNNSMGLKMSDPIFLHRFIFMPAVRLSFIPRALLTKCEFYVIQNYVARAR